jgi:hypothetical protein
VLVLPGIQPQDAQTGAVIERGVLKDARALHLDHLHIHWHRVAGPLFFKELELSRLALRRLRDPGRRRPAEWSWH